MNNDSDKEAGWKTAGNKFKSSKFKVYPMFGEDPKSAFLRNKKQKTKKENKFKMQFEDFKNNSNSEFLFNFLDEKKNLDEEEQNLREDILKRFLVQEGEKIKKLKQGSLHEKSKRNISKKEIVEVEESLTDLEWVFDKSFNKVSFQNFKNLLSKSPSRVNNNVYIRALEILKTNFEKIEQDICETNEEMIYLDKETEELKDEYVKVKSKQKELEMREKELDSQIYNLTNELRDKKETLEKKKTKNVKEKPEKKKTKKVETNQELIQKMKKSKILRINSNNTEKNSKHSLKKLDTIRRNTGSSLAKSTQFTRILTGRDLKAKGKKEKNESKKSNLQINSKVIKGIEEDFSVSDINKAFTEIQDLFQILEELQNVYQDDPDFSSELKVYKQLIEGYEEELKDAEHQKQMTIYNQKLEIEKLKKKILLLEESII